MLSSLGVVLAIPKVARRSARWIGLSLAAAVAVAGCGSAAASAGPGQIVAVGAENEYADVISQIGGRYVSVTAIESNPNTDPHTFEASPSVAQDGRASPAGGPERRRLRHLHEQDRVGLAELVAEGDRRPEAARASRLDAKPTPLVHAADDARGRGRAGQGPVGAPALARRLLRRQRETVRRLAAALVPGAEAVRRALPRHAGGDHRAGRRLHAAGGRAR